MSGWQQSDRGSDTGGEPAAAGRARQLDPERLLIPRLGHNLRAGLQLAFMRRVDLDAFRIDFAQIVALIILSALAACFSGFMVTKSPRGFDLYGVTSYATHLLIFIAAVLLVCEWIERREKRSALFVALLSGTLAVQVLTPLMIMLAYKAHPEYAMQAGWGIWLAAAAWSLAIAARSTKLVSGRRLFNLLLPIAGYALIVYGMVFVVPLSQMWYSRAPAASASNAYAPQRVDAESTYYAQARLLRESLDRLAPERNGVSDLYFIGFANYAHQDVFRKEIELARTLMDERFDTRGRSMTLINNAATVDQVPLANRPNLARALNAIGARMNIDEDVLFLFLTSHGSRDGALAARFWPLRPNSLSSADLKEVLDQSGIRWRILVVSACYSGTFIDPLKDEYTLILTASRKDRNSFGCSNDREFTYFGEHFFARELRQGKSLLEAFEAARVSLAEREKVEGFTPSEPQIHLGEQMRTKLAEIEARLSGR